MQLKSEITTNSTLQLPELGKIEKDHTFNGKYRVLKTLGEGMSAEVYLAEEIGSNQKVALKIFNEQYMSG